MKKTAILLMLITILSKVFGFGREITLSYFYGASNISDAYLISQTIPTVIFSFIGTSLATGYIPLYSNLDYKYGEKEANRYTSNLTNILLVVCTGIICFGFIFTEVLVKIFASGFEGDTLILAVKFTRIGLLGIYFTGLINIFGGLLRIKKNYVIPASVGFPLNLILILSIFLSSKTSTMMLAVGSVVASASQLALLIPFLRKKGYKHSAVIDFKDEYIKKMVTMALPLIIGLSVNEINVIVDKTLASNIAIGGISALNYAAKLKGFVMGLFVTTIITVMYPVISKMAAQSNIEGMKRTIAEAVNSINLLVVPASVGAMVFAEPVVRFVFRRGAFDAGAALMTTDALFFYSIGMIGFGLRNVLSRAFYSMQDTRTPMINAAIAVVLNIVLNLILSRFLGIGGLALATSISSLFCTGLLFYSLRKKIGHFGMKNMVVSFVKILGASLVMGLITYLANNVLLRYFGSNLSLISSICIGVVVYSAIIYFAKIEEVDTLVNVVKKRLGNYFEH
jgi:putative peptidoglycan lipid II flippase